MLQPVTGSLISAAAELAGNHGLRASDALHLATALAAHDAFGLPVVMVASDRELEAATRAEALGCLNPEALDALTRLRSLQSAP